MTTSTTIHALPSPPAPAGFAELLAAYLSHLHTRNYSPNTTRTIRVVLSAFGRYCDPCHASEADVEAWLSTRHLGPNARGTYVQYLAGWYRWAVRRGYVKSDPTVNVERPKVVRGMPRPIPDPALAIALARADARMRLFLCLGAYQGMRCQEIAGLCAEHIWDAIDPPMLLVAAGKGGRQRTMGLNVHTAAALDAYGRPSSGPLFHRRGCDCPIRAQTVTIYVARYLHSLGIPQTAHTLRHWFGSTLYQQTLDIRVVQHALGHASIGTTQVYAAFASGAGDEVIRHLSVG